MLMEIRGTRLYVDHRGPENAPAVGPTEITRFQQDVRDGTYRCFEAVGHFVHAEAADAYTQLVTSFVLGQ
jgi:hypothetical protein